MGGAATHPGLRHSPEEIKRLGEEFFDREIRRAVADLPPDHFLAIDAEGRGWRAAETSAAATDALREVIPDAQIWKRRVGPGPAFHFAGGLSGGPAVGGGGEARFVPHRAGSGGPA